MEYRGDKKQFCIVIPIYKEHLDCIEKLSLTQLWNVVGDKHYDIYFVRPNTKCFDMSEYYILLPEGANYVYEKVFDENYFKSTATYSQLCMLYEFYNIFSDYEYMYIYQLDCYLLEDKLKYFCDLGYDYIGSPIMSTDCGWPTVDKDGNFTPAIGNGGFSLRKISTFKEITDVNGEFRKYYKLTDELLSNVQFEDLYFCVFVKDKYDMNFPNINIAYKFSWDMNADIIYDLWNIHILPMCIHAWDKNIRFWKKHLSNISQKIVNYCENKHEQFFKIYYNENDSSAR